MSANLLEEQVIGGLASAQDPGALLSWLQPFGSDVRTTCESWIRSYPHQTWITGPVPSLARFRLAVSHCLSKVRHTLEAASQHVPPPGFMIWGFENHENQGLDDFEIEALFAALVDTEHIQQIDRGAAVSKIVMAGKLRDEVLGLAFQITERDLRGRSRLHEGLRLLAERRLPVTTIFIDHTTASAIAADRQSVTSVSILKVLDRCGAAPGLYVPETRANAALQSLKREADPLRALAGDIAPVNHVYFKKTRILHSPYISREMSEAGFRYDSSIAVRRRTWNRSHSPYVAGAYQPAVFDPLIPRATWSDDSWIECPLFHVSISNSEAFWAWRRNTRWKQLAQLLDFNRTEKYFTDAAKRPALNRKYHEYRVYNWRKPEPSPRCSLLNCGHLSDLSQLEATLQYGTALPDATGVRARMVGHRAFFYAVEGEARRRSLASSGAAPDERVPSHAYLNTIGEAAPLREDVQEFIRFLPSHLRTVLELGRGTGQLAKILRRQSDVYVATDIAIQRTAHDESDALCITDAHVLPFREGSFDTVLANNILEHLYEPLVSLKEVQRVLKPGGRLYALIPLDGLNPEYELRTHLWKATRDNIGRALRLAGLIVVRMKVMDLYKLGVNAPFPSCKGLACAVEAKRGG
jgi:SAM-dependent methyltransferase